MNMNKAYLKDEIEQFREKGYQFEKGEIGRGEFKGISGGMGCYAQKDAGKYMIRLKTPAGVIPEKIWALIIGYCEKYQITKLHLTTRQAIQLHDLSIDEVCDIMIDALDHDLFTRGGGGNYPRNAALSPLAGVDPEEVFDATPFALMVGEYFQERVTTYNLPRKLKVAFSSEEQQDTACATVNDMGFIPILKDGQPYFALYLAGGIGAGPGVGYKYPEAVAPEDVLYYVEAMVRLFMAEGDYQHKAKARLRFIPRRMGVAEFMECYQGHVQAVKESEQLDCIYTKAKPYLPWASKLDEYSMVIAQKQKDRYTVVVHPQCGQLQCADAKTILKFLNEVPTARLRTSMSEDIYIRDLTQSEAVACVALVAEFNEISQIGRTVTCIGTPSCQQGVIKSQSLCVAINQAVVKAGVDANALPAIHISGCPSSCSRHPVCPIGFMGKRVKCGTEMVDCFELHLNGHVGVDAHLGTVCGVILAERVPAFIVDFIKLIKSSNAEYAQVIERPEFGALLKKYCV